MLQELVPRLDQLPDLSWKEKVAYLTVQFLKLDQAETPVKHSFEPGVYIREMFIPAGTLFLGRAHQHGHRCELIRGELTHITPEGNRDLAAPFEVMTTPGYHMVFRAITDVYGRTIHPNPDECRDVQKLEDDIFESIEVLKALGREVEQKLESPCLA